MQLIRQQCFETNSSSCHSISLANKPTEFATIYPAVRNSRVINIDLGEYEFGWEEADYTGPEAKLAYLLIDIGYLDNPDSLEAKAVSAVVKDHTGCRLSVTKSGTAYSGGYIDHQSEGTCRESGVLSSDEAIKSFVFSPDSVLTTDNDNH